jgi:Protein DA1
METGPAMTRVTCVACGNRRPGQYQISLWGEATCATHAAVGDCLLCGRQRISRAETGWANFTSRTWRCPTCVRNGIQTQDNARRHIPLVWAQMANLGIQLRRRVRVRVVDPDSLRPDGTDGILFGVTHHQLWSTGDVDVVGIQVAAGLPPAYFGATLAHEIGHAWLGERGAVQLDAPIAEGVCELFAAAWLKKQRTRMADALRRQMATNPSPVYGDGYRRARAAVARHGIHTVLDHVVTRRFLPID